MDDTPDPDIPIRWLTLEHKAETLMCAALGDVSNATFHYRAARDVLALSLLVGNHAPAASPDVDLKTLTLHLVDGSHWRGWCSSHLARILPVLSTADCDLARNAWRWLTGNRLLADSTSLCRSAFTAAKGCEVGVEQARQVVNVVLGGNR